MNRNELPPDGDPRVVRVEVHVTDKGSLNEALANCVDDIRESLFDILVIRGTLVMTLGPLALTCNDNTPDDDEKPAAVEKAPVTPEK